jgi:hypothetical protein
MAILRVFVTGFLPAAGSLHEPLAKLRIGLVGAGTKTKEMFWELG